MPPKIDKGAYKQGREFFNSGKTIKEMVDGMQTREAEMMKDQKERENWREHEAREFSILIGFADAFLDRLRGIKR